MAKNDKKPNWFKRHKVLTVVLAFIVLGAVASGSSTEKNSTNSSTKDTTATQPTNKTARFTDRADIQKTDVELALNEAGTVGGVKLTVASAEYRSSLSDYETAPSGKTYALVTVSLENTSDSTKPYNPLDFRVQTAGGQVLDDTFVSSIDTLHSGDLVTGGKVSGIIAFELPVEDGHQYLIWKPGLKSDRAIVQIK